MINLWCKEHCESQFKVDCELLDQQMKVNITFNSDEDQMFFKLAFPQIFVD